MSEESVDLIMRHADAASRQDVDAFLATLSPDVEWEDAMYWSEPMRVYRGREEVGEWFERAVVEMSESGRWAGGRMEVEEVIPAGEDRVVAGVLVAGRGRGSGVEVKGHGWIVFWCSDGLITRRRPFLDRAEALEAAGLSAYAMSEENVEIVRRALEAVSARLELPRELLHPDYELDLTDSGGPLLRGIDAAQETMREYWETFDDFQYEVEEVIHADEDHVVVSVRDGGRMKGSDAEVWTRFFDVVTLRQGKIVRLSAHTDRNRALTAAGLSK